MEHKPPLGENYYLIVTRPNDLHHNIAIAMTSSKARVAHTLEKMAMEDRRAYKINPEFLTEIKEINLS